jgi:hypothetical protein
VADAAGVGDVSVTWPGVALGSIAEDGDGVTSGAHAAARIAMVMARTPSRRIGRLLHAMPGPGRGPGSGSSASVSLLSPVAP